MMAIVENQTCEIAMKMTIQASEFNGKLQIVEQKIEIAKCELRGQKESQSWCEKEVR
jgi:hypothetical protein